jgi:hypothetical protein
MARFTKLYKCKFCGHLVEMETAGNDLLNAIDSLSAGNYQRVGIVCPTPKGHVKHAGVYELMGVMEYEN